MHPTWQCVNLEYSNLCPTNVAVDMQLTTYTILYLTLSMLGATILLSTLVQNIPDGTLPSERQTTLHWYEQLRDEKSFLRR